MAVLGLYFKGTIPKIARPNRLPESTCWSPETLKFSIYKYE
jgi:hypothetical protein